MLTIPTHIEAAKRLAVQKAPIHITVPTREEYLRRLAHVAAQWPDRRPAAPAWAPLLVRVVLDAPVHATWGMP